MTENALRLDILAQGENIREVVAHLYGQERQRLEAAAQFLRNERPIALIGVASARYICTPAEQYLCERGRFARAIPASDAIYGLLPLLKNANVIINSRSGETAEVVKLAHLLAEAKIPFVAVTNAPESTLAALAPYRVWSKARPDDLVSINVVSGMMTATLALAAAVSGDLERLRPEFEALEEHLTAATRRAWERAATWQSLFDGLRPIYLLYRGYARAAALCGRLVLEEVARTPAVALEAAEFRQGPNEVIDERFGAVVFVPDGRQGELNRSLAGDILESGGRVLAIGKLDGLVESPRLGCLELPDLPDYLFPIPAVVPLQILAYTLAQSQGFPPGQVRYITKVILSEEGIPNATGLIPEKKPR
jgi:glucosamine--fructose-6-phosphate aminotransferase (isomerizing)